MAGDYIWRVDKGVGTLVRMTLDLDACENGEAEIDRCPVENRAVALDRAVLFKRLNLEQGDGDKPTRSANVMLGGLASACSSSRIFRSIASSVILAGSLTLRPRGYNCANQRPKE